MTSFEFIAEGVNSVICFCNRQKVTGWVDVLCESYN